jgi:membrane-bound lytic murein transglycosylase A
LADGELMTFGYAANNGHEYRGISKQMIADGSITRDQLNLSSMIEYFKRNPQDVGRYTMMNPRFVFFRHEPGGTPRGSLNECVTPMRTIATDKEIFPRGSVTFIETNLPQQGGYGSMPYSGFTVDQDTGGAIRAPGRCDIYIGEGDEAGKLAGATYQEGRLYYLFLKDN